MWQRKPPPGIPIDRSHPMAKDLVFFCKFDEADNQTDLVHNQVGSKLETGTSTVDRIKAAGPFGDNLVQTWNQAGSNRAGFDFGDREEYRLAGGSFTIMARWRDTGTYASGWSRVVSRRMTSPGNDEYAVIMQSADNFYSRVAGSDHLLQLTGRNISPYGWMDSYVRFDTTIPTTNQILQKVWDLTHGQSWVGVGTESGEISDGTGHLCIGHRQEEQRVWDGEIDYVAIWKTPYDLDWAEEFRANPWQIFKRRTILVPMTGQAVVVEVAPDGTTVIITDVNTNETWQDGATGLIVTGTGFV